MSNAGTQLKEDDEGQFQNETYKGEKLPPALGRTGPQKGNSLTDFFCCILFLGYIAGMVAIVVLNLANSHIGSMREASDSEGNICGKSEGFEDYKLLYFFNFQAPFRSVCVKECPRFDYNQIRYNSSGQETKTVTPLYFEGFNKAVETEWRLNGGQGKYKGGNVDGTEAAKDESNPSNMFAYSAFFARKYFTEEQWNEYTGRQKLDCKTNDDVGSCKNDPEKKNFIYDTYTLFEKICFPIAPQIAKYTGSIGDMGSATEDLRVALWAIVISIVAALIVSMLVLLLTRIFLGCIIWTLIVVLILSLFLLAFSCFALLYLSGATGAAEWIEKLGSQRAQQLQKVMENKKLLLIIGISSFLLGVLLLVYVCKQRKAISVASGVLEWSAKFLFSHPSLFIMMIFCFILQLATLIACAYGILAVHTSGQETRNKERGDPFPHFPYDAKKIAQIVFLGIGTYWTLAFWNNVCDFTSAAATVNVYFKKTESIVMGPFCAAFIFHLGSVAYGSLVLGIAGIFKLIFGWLQALARDEKPNAIQRFLGKLCCLCLWPFEKCCMRLDDNAFSMVWLTKLNFCPSAKKEFYLNRRIGEKIGNSSWIGTFYSLCARVGIVAIITYISWNVFTRVKYYHTNISNPLIPTIVVFLIGLVVSTLVMNVFSAICGSALTCYLVQLDCNEKPFYKELNDTLNNNNTTTKDGNKYHELQ